MQGKSLPDKRAKVEITINKPDSVSYKKILALAGAKVHERSVTKAAETGSTITISIAADDIPSLCAATNSVLRDILVLTAATGAK